MAAAAAAGANAAAAAAAAANATAAVQAAANALLPPQHGSSHSYLSDTLERVLHHQRRERGRDHDGDNAENEVEITTATLTAGATAGVIVWDVVGAVATRIFGACKSVHHSNAGAPRSVSSKHPRLHHDT